LRKKKSNDVRNMTRSDRMRFSTPADCDGRDLGFVGEESVRFKEAEIIVWVSLADIRTEAFNPVTPCFPAILDTGHTHNFAIREQQLIRWVGIRPEGLRRLGTFAKPAGEFPSFSQNLAAPQ